MDSHCSFKFGMLFEPFATQIYNIFLGKAKFFRKKKKRHAQDKLLAKMLQS